MKKNLLQEKGESSMKCPYCNENAISPFKKLIYENIKCISCGKIVHFSKNKRTISGLVFIIAIFFDNILNTERTYNLIVFLGLTIVLFFILMMIPAEMDK